MFLCQQFVGLNPFEVKKRDFREVLELYTQLVISLYQKQNKDNSKQNNATWVTSKTATWH